MFVRNNERCTRIKTEGNAQFTIGLDPRIVVPRPPITHLHRLKTMAYSIIRVELHKDDQHTPHEIAATCYRELHASMERAGYMRSYSTSTKKKFQLPPAEYIKYGDEAADRLRDAVAVIAKKIMGNDKQFSIVVTKVADFASHNLKQLTS